MGRQPSAFSMSLVVSIVVVARPQAGNAKHRCRKCRFPVCDAECEYEIFSQLLTHFVDQRDGRNIKIDFCIDR